MKKEQFSVGTETPLEEKPEPTPPVIDTSKWWVLEERTVRKSDGRVLVHTARYMNTSAVSKMRIAYVSGQQQYEFRHGKPIEIELMDVFTTLTLHRPQRLKKESKNEVTPT